MHQNKINHGDEFIAVNDSKGGFSLKPKKNNDSGGGAGFLVLALIIIVIFLALLCSPLIFAIYAFYVNEESAKKMRIYSIGMFIGMIAALYFIFPQFDSLKSFSEEILSYEKLVRFFWILNGFGIISSIAGLSKIVADKPNKIVSIVATMVFILVTIFLNKNTLFSGKIEPSFTNEQLKEACDCYNNSYEVTKIKADDLGYEERQLRIKCMDLFKPKDFRYLEDDLDIIFQNMKKACEEQH